MWRQGRGWDLQQQGPDEETQAGNPPAGRPLLWVKGGSGEHLAAVLNNENLHATSGKPVLPWLEDSLARHGTALKAFQKTTSHMQTLALYWLLRAPAFASWRCQISPHLECKSTDCSVRHAKPCGNKHIIMRYINYTLYMTTTLECTNTDAA